MGRSRYFAAKRPTLRKIFHAFAVLASGLSLVSCAVTSKGSSPATNASISITPSLVSFGDVKIKSETSQTLRLSNTGTTDLAISQATLSGTGFSMSGLSAPQTVAAGTSMNFTVSFQPTTTGAASGSISISSNASSTPLTVSLTGTGVTTSTPAISVTPTAVSFGNLTVKTSASQIVKLSNTGTADLAISQATLAGTGFSMSGLTAPLTLTAGTSMNFTVSFQPMTTGAASGSISISSNAGSTPLTVSLTGTGVTASAPAISVTPTAVSFGNLTVKTSASQTVKLSNTGTADLAISQATLAGTGFSMSGLTAPLTLTAGTSTNFTVSFQPLTTGAASGSLSISSNASPSPLTISLTGTGVAATVILTPSVTTLAFGSVTVNATAAQNVQLANKGNAQVNISSVVATGAGFSSTGGSNVTLEPNQSVTVVVSFDPQTQGTFSGTLSIASNASPLTIPLSGTGAAAVQHSITIAWDPSTSSGVAGYFVYRSTSSSGSFTKVGSTNNSTTTFTDTTVQGGQTYFYEVASVDSNNVESNFDGPVQATTP